MENFKLPLFAVNIQEYWKRWHISLTTWLTDYVFSPLNIKLRDWGNTGLYIATLVNLLAIGLWHGANWTFVWFGLYHGICLVFNSAINKKRKSFEKRHQLKNSTAYRYARISKMFIFVSIGLILFRSNSVTDFCGYISQLHSGFGALFPVSVTLCMSLAILIFKEWKDEHGLHLSFLHSDNVFIKTTSFAALMFYIVCFGNLTGGSFIYFQF
jgi:D-alanyl-lipoteichoic acid acyltransferase DltB (MBOAT superfamily)